MDPSPEKVPINIKPLLQDIEPSPPKAANANAGAIALAISNIFTNQLSPVQTAVLLDRLATTGLDHRPDVLAKCSDVMRSAAETVDVEELRRISQSKNLRHGGYEGGLCDIVGTGGDGHSTFNISTASSIIASSLLQIAKHGNRASTSRSGSAEVLSSIKTPKQPTLEAVTNKTLAKVYLATNYGFLFAPNFHTGLRNVAAIRKELPGPSIFNLLGPLTNPAGPAIEASVIGVKTTGLVPVFAEALRIIGARKGMVVCGVENLDEISCAGPSRCARLVNRATPHELPRVEIEEFALSPGDFGLPANPLSTVSPGLTPDKNADILSAILRGEREEDPILGFVLMNTAALLVISGICDSDACPFGRNSEISSEVGPGQGRWKEGVRLARHAIKSGRAFHMLKKFADVTNNLPTGSD